MRIKNSFVAATLLLWALPRELSATELPGGCLLTNHTFDRIAAAMATRQDEVWIGTQGGGVLVWNTS